MSLIQSASMNGHDPYAYLKDVLTQRASEIDQTAATIMGGSLSHVRWLRRLTLMVPATIQQTLGPVGHCALLGRVLPRGVRCSQFFKLDLALTMVTLAT